MKHRRNHCKLSNFDLRFSFAWLDTISSRHIYSIHEYSPIELSHYFSCFRLLRVQGGLDETSTSRATGKHLDTARAITGCLWGWKYNNERYEQQWQHANNGVTGTCHAQYFCGSLAHRII